MSEAGFIGGFADAFQSGVAANREASEKAIARRQKRDSALEIIDARKNLETTLIETRNKNALKLFKDKLDAGAEFERNQLDKVTEDFKEIDFGDPRATDVAPGPDVSGAQGPLGPAAGPDFPTTDVPAEPGAPPNIPFGPVGALAVQPDFGPDTTPAPSVKRPPTFTPTERVRRRVSLTLKVSAERIDKIVEQRSILEEHREAVIAAGSDPSELGKVNAQLVKLDAQLAGETAASEDQLFALADKARDIQKDALRQEHSERIQDIERRAAALTVEATEIAKQGPSEEADKRRSDINIERMRLGEERGKSLDTMNDAIDDLGDVVNNKFMTGFINDAKQTFNQRKTEEARIGGAQDRADAEDERDAQDAARETVAGVSVVGESPSTPEIDAEPGAERTETDLERTATSIPLFSRQAALGVLVSATPAERQRLLRLAKVSPEMFKDEVVIKTADIGRKRLAAEAQALIGNDRRDELTIAHKAAYNAEVQNIFKDVGTFRPVAPTSAEMGALEKLETLMVSSDALIKEAEANIGDTIQVNKAMANAIKLTGKEKAGQRKVEITEKTLALIQAHNANTRFQLLRRQFMRSGVDFSNQLGAQLQGLQNKIDSMNAANRKMIGAIE